MEQKTLKERVEYATNEAKTLAEYWTGTLHESLIEMQLNALVEALHEGKEEVVEERLETLQNTVATAREEIERAENEG